jgi:uncharacterized membrane protein YeaQ/YmgE (transglycosylase-associated protein family)
MYWFLYLLIGLTVGLLATFLVKKSDCELWVNLLVGVIGAIFGAWLLSLTNISLSQQQWTLLSATVSSMVFVFLINLVMYRKPIEE